MKVLIINAGSSSVKFTCFDMDQGQVLADGLVERIGIAGTRLIYRNHRGESVKQEVQVNNTTEAVGLVTAFLTDKEHGVIDSTKDIAAVGHRMVHGGERITASTIIDEQVKAIVRDCIELAPLHNPPNLDGVEACEKHFPCVPQVGVFDTAFHTTMPPRAYLYAIPHQLYREHKIRRYGFHGTSHKYVAHEAARYLGRSIERLNIITCHLGNGCSMAAVQNGKCIDTSMGMTPLEGLIMGTRSGDIDPEIIFYLMNHLQTDAASIKDLLNKKSGLLGLADIGSSDLRDILAAKDQGDKKAEAAVMAFTYRIRKYIGAYAAALGGVDAVVFTAGIGENAPLIREMSCEGLKFLGIEIDPGKNAARSRETREIQTEAGRVKVLVVPTDEEQEIARQTLEVLNAASIG